MNHKFVVLAMLAIASAAALAQQEEEPTKFAYHCEWMEGKTKKWEVHHVNLPYKIVDGQPAKIDGNAIVFVQNGTERRIDLQTGVMESRSLAQGAAAQSEVRECKKTPAMPL